MEIKQWKTSELIEFLNSYNRVFKEDRNKALPYQKLYVKAFNELHNRSPLLALVY